jgi:hypothetical protein
MRRHTVTAILTRRMLPSERRDTVHQAINHNQL